MSNNNQNNRPRMSLPGGAPPPLAPPPIPPSTNGVPFPAHVDALLQRFPLPWCVGPDGYIWVAADVVKITDPDDRKPGDSADGWRATGNVARLVIEVALPAETAAVILYAVNKLTVR